MPDDDQSQAPVRYYERCRCLHCKCGLDETPTTAKRCPRCDRELDPHDVWSTRRYSGVLVLPPWITAFGWPLLLIVLGVALMAGSYVGSGRSAITIPAGIIGTGITWFLVKLMVRDDD